MSELSKPKPADVMPTNDDDVNLQQLHEKTIQYFNNAKSLVNSLKTAAARISDPQLQSFCIALSESHGALLDFSKSQVEWSIPHQSLDTKVIVHAVADSIKTHTNESNADHSHALKETLQKVGGGGGVGKYGW